MKTIYSICLFLFIICIFCVFADEYQEFKTRIKNAPRKADSLSFASYYGDNMVLQGYPYKSTIWGHAPNGSHYGLVDVVIYPGLFTYEATVQEDLTWSVVVGPLKIDTPVRIQASMGDYSVSVKNVLFGDVWLCSGQSNMAFALSQVFNASAELKDSLNYPDIRIFELNLKTSKVPLTDLYDDGIMVPWSVPNPDNLGGKPFTHFSAVCWLYGKYLYQTLKKPIGLIDTSWGGTPVEAWSSPDALKKCGLSANHRLSYQPYKSEDGFQGPQEATEIWNAMVHPLLKMTIYGAIWYQGENNAHRNKHLYNCTFPTMIDDWREKFHLNGETNNMFPFGFVQIAPYHADYTEDTGFPEIRWHQTADYGFVPNYRQRNVFMAVAIDLPDFASPYDGSECCLDPNIRRNPARDGPIERSQRLTDILGTGINRIHPRDKQDVAARLARGGLALGYGYEVSFQGPYPVKLYIYKEKSRNYTQIEVEYTMNLEQRWTEGFEIYKEKVHNYTQIEIEYTMNLEQQWTEGFEICCSYVTPAECAPGKSWWIPASTVLASDRANVTITKASSCDINQLVGIRYLWRDSPCTFKRCDLYGAENQLPVPPFIYSGKNFEKIKIDEHKYIIKI